jgi:hypothetical protein
VGFVTIFEEFFNDFRDFFSWPDKNLTMDGKARQERYRFGIITPVA